MRSYHCRIDPLKEGVSFSSGFHMEVGSQWTAGKQKPCSCWRSSCVQGHFARGGCQKWKAPHTHIVFWVYNKYGLTLRGIHCSAIPLVAAISESCGNILQRWFIPGVSWTGEECERWWLRADWSLIVFAWRGVLVNLPSQSLSQVVMESAFIVWFLQDGPSLRGWHGHSPTTATRCSSWHPSANMKSAISSRDWQRWAHAHTYRLLITICNNNNKTVTNYFY